MKRCRVNKQQYNKKNVVPGISKLYQIPGLIELVYGFFMNNNVLDQTLFFDLRSVCKDFQSYSNSLVAFLCPTIKSLGSVDFWSRVTPNLKSIYSCSSLQYLSFYNLRKLTLETGNPRLELNVCNWQCPLLESIDASEVCTTQVEMEAIAQQFVHLTYLSVYIKSESRFLISNFAHLEKLQLSTNYECLMELSFVNLPCLEELDINNGFKSFHFYDVPNLTTIKSMDYFYVRNIIFHNPVPHLVNVNLGLDLLLSLDSYNNVKWENMRDLKCIYSDCSAKHLAKLKSLTHLSITYPPVDFLHVISCLHETLQKLDILWDDRFTLDFKLLLNFRNIKHLDICNDCGKYIHFEDVFQLPKLQVFSCHVNLLISEKNLYQKWVKKQISQRIFFPKI